MSYYQWDLKKVVNETPSSRNICEFRHVEGLPVIDVLPGAARIYQWPASDCFSALHSRTDTKISTKTGPRNTSGYLYLQICSPDSAELQNFILATLRD